MFYKLVKVIARLAFRFYCRDLKLNNPALLKSEGPLLLAANHPNSFLDAIILCTLFNRPVYSLARGDAFKGKFLSRILTALKLLPVYRVSEGVENLEENYKTFDACKDIFKQDGIVLIFSEGRCVNEWHLRPLKKGTARLALSCWADGIPLKVLPVAINYSSFTSFGKNIQLYFGSFIASTDIGLGNGYGRSIQKFNEKLHSQLQPMVCELNPQSQQFQDVFYRPVSTLKRMILFIPSFLGWVLHALLYKAITRTVKHMLNSSDHYDSLVVAISFVVYPFYVIFLTVVTVLLTDHWTSFLVLVFIPFTAWAHIQLKKQIRFSRRPTSDHLGPPMISNIKTGEQAV